MPDRVRQHSCRLRAPTGSHRPALRPMIQTAQAIQCAFPALHCCSSRRTNHSLPSLLRRLRRLRPLCPARLPLPPPPCPPRSSQAHPAPPTKTPKAKKLPQQPRTGALQNTSTACLPSFSILQTCGIPASTSTLPPFSPCQSPAADASSINKPLLLGRIALAA
jgi:hypothetical protein